LSNRNFLKGAYSGKKSALSGVQKPPQYIGPFPY
jgi:hypothetical protein